MNLISAIFKARKTSKIIKNTCYVVKFKSKVRWYSVNTWFRFENVTQDYIDNHNYKGSIYYTVTI